jgi:aspartate/glutamate racemase
VTALDLPFTAVAEVRAAGADEVVLLAGSPTEEPGVYRATATGEVRTVRAPRERAVLHERSPGRVEPRLD